MKASSQITSELDAEAAQMESVRSLIPASRPKSSACLIGCGGRAKAKPRTP